MAFHFYDSTFIIPLSGNLYRLTRHIHALLGARKKTKRPLVTSNKLKLNWDGRKWKISLKNMISPPTRRIHKNAQFRQNYLLLLMRGEGLGWHIFSYILKYSIMYHLLGKASKKILRKMSILFFDAFHNIQSVI